MFYGKSILRKRGVSILEIMIAFGILIFVLTPTMELLYSANTERIRMMPNFEYGNLKIPNPHLSWSDDGAEAFVGRAGNIWKPILVDSFKSQGSSCLNLDSARLSERGRVPKIFEYSQGELGFSSTTYATGVGIIGNRIFISANSSSTTDPDLFSFDIVDANSASQNSRPVLTVASKKDTGPGLNSLTVRGNQILSGNTSVNGQAQIFDSRTLSNSMSFKIPGSNSTTSPITKVVRMYRGIVLVGTEKSVLPEIAIFRMSDGVLLGQIETGYGINDMAVVGDLLLVASPKDPEIDVFDISSVSDLSKRLGYVPPVPQSELQKVSEYDALGGSGNGKVFSLNGDSLYLGRTKGGDELLGLEMGYVSSSSAQNDLQKESVYFSNSPKFTLGLTENLHAKIGWSVDALISDKPYVLVFSADAGKELQVFEEKKTLLSETSVAFLSSANLPGRVSTVACRSGTLYVTTQLKEIPLLIIKL